MSLSKDVSFNFYVHQTEYKMEENTVYMHMKLHNIILLLQCFSGKGGREYELWSITMSTDYQNEEIK